MEELLLNLCDEVDLSGARAQCGGHENKLFRPPTAGSITDRKAQLLCSEIQTHLCWGHNAPWAAPSQWLRVAGIWRQTHSWETWTPLVGNPGLRTFSDSFVKPPLYCRSVWNNARQCPYPPSFNQSQICLWFYHHPSFTQLLSYFPSHRYF